MSIIDILIELNMFLSDCKDVGSGENKHVGKDPYQRKVQQSLLIKTKHMIPVLLLFRKLPHET